MPNDFGKLILRIGFGATMLLAHGWPKLANFSQSMNTFPDPLGIGNSLSLGLAIFAEVLCALLVALGESPAHCNHVCGLLFGPR